MIFDPNKFIEITDILPRKKGSGTVYAIRNNVDGKIYIGSSGQFLRRLFFHKSRLNSGKHYNKHLQEAWIKYGEISFSLHYRAKAVMQFDLEGNLIKKWDCISDASRFFKIHRNKIIDACSGKQKIVTGFVWNYCQTNNFAVQREK